MALFDSSSNIATEMPNTAFEPPEAQGNDFQSVLVLLKTNAQSTHHSLDIEYARSAPSLVT